MAKLQQSCWRQHCLISITATFLFLLHHVTSCLFTVREEKNCTPGFNSWSSVLTKFAYSKEISRTVIFTIRDQKFDDVIDNILASFEPNCIVSNLIYVIFLLKIPCAKFHASSCSQTRVKVGGHFCPTSKSEFENPTQNRVKVIYNVMKSLTSLKKSPVDSYEGRPLSVQIW